MSSLELIHTSYEHRRPTAERFATRLVEQINELLRTGGISLAVPIEFRIKPWDSISEKIDRLKIDVTNVLELTDFVGIRIILLFRRDLNNVCKILSSNLEVFDSENTLERLGTDQFGYQSIHLRIKLPDHWFQIPTFRDFGELSAEVQVRTAAQHIWATASHVLQYKKESSIPIPVRRSINRVSALLETVDLEFDRALSEREKYTENIAATEINELLNVDLLKKILDRTLPANNKVPDEPYEDLLETLQVNDIKTSQSLITLIKTHLENARDKDCSIVEILRSKGKKQKDGEVYVEIEDKGIIYSYHSRPDRIDRGVYYTHSGLIRAMLLD